MQAQAQINLNMKKSFYRRSNCRMCGSRNVECVVKMAPTPAGDAYISAEYLTLPQETYPMDIFLCHHCGLLQLLDVVDPDILYGNYIYNTAISLGLAEHFQRYADEIIDYTKLPGGSLVIDVGSNDGTLLKCFKKRGMSVLGVDPAHELAERATDAGIETVPAFFNSNLAEKIKTEHGFAKIITVNNVFANIDDVTDMMCGVRTLLAPDGLFVFETGYVVDLVQQTILDNVYHEHLSYYSVKPLKNFFSSHAMELIDIKRVSTKGGSLRGIAQCIGGPYKVSQSIDEFLKREEVIGIHRAEIFKAFSQRIENVKTQLKELLSEIKAEKKNIACYGASVGVTTLLYFFEVGETFTFIVDDNPTRYNLFSPGFHIPVFSSQALYERKPEYAVIMAWRYAEPILQKHREFLRGGGHFIIPLPELKII